MNRYDYKQEIDTTRKAIGAVRDFVTRLKDAQSEMDNHGDIIDSEAEATTLSIAADILQSAIPKE